MTYHSLLNLAEQEQLVHRTVRGLEQLEVPRPYSKAREEREGPRTANAYYSIEALILNESQW